MTFSYFRQPENSEQQAAEAKRQSENLKSTQKFALNDLRAQLLNERGTENVYQQLAEFSETLSNTGEKLLTKHIEDQTAKAHYDYRRGGEKNSSQLQELTDANEKQSRFINKVADEMEEAEGGTSIIAEEVRNKDPYYQAAIQRLEIQDRVSEARLALEDAKETLTITDDNGDELSYYDINGGADMAAWTAAFEQKFIRENFSNITPEAFAALVDEPLGTVISTHVTTWATENAQRQKSRRMELAQLEITKAIQSGNDVTSIAMNHIRSGRLTRSNVASVLKNMMLNGQLSDNMMLRMETETFAHTGGGTSTLAKELGADWPAIKQAKFANDKRLYDNDNLQYMMAEREVEKGYYQGLQTDNDGYRSESYIKQAQKEFMAANNGRRSAFLDKMLREQSAEVKVSKELVEGYKEQIRQGTFNRSLLLRLPESVANPLRQYLELPQNKAQLKGVKAHEELIDEIAKKGAESTAAGIYDPSVGLMTIKLKEMFRDRMELHGDTPAEAYQYVNSWFLNEVDKDIKQAGQDLTKRRFKNSKGYPGMIKSRTDVLREASAKNEDYQKIVRYYQAMSRKSIEESPGAILSNEQLAAKAKELQQGVIEFSDRDRFAANILGYAHPISMYQAFANKERNYEGPEMEVPPIIQIAEDTFTESDKRMMGLYPSINRVSRVYAKNGLVSELPIRLNTGAKETEMLSYMQNDLGMSQIHALGLLVNAIRESSLKTTNPGDGGLSDGLFQWHRDRLTRAKEYLGDSWDDWRAQIQYAIEEPGEPGQEYLQTQFSSPQEAADWWMNRWERPLHPERDSKRHTEILRSLR